MHPSNLNQMEEQVVCKTLDCTWMEPPIMYNIDATKKKITQKARGSGRCCSSQTFAPREWGMHAIRLKLKPGSTGRPRNKIGITSNYDNKDTPADSKTNEIYYAVDSLYGQRSSHSTNGYAEMWDNKGYWCNGIYTLEFEINFFHKEIRFCKHRHDRDADDYSRVMFDNIR